MVVSLGPGKFYGTSLPRPRIYTDVKFNDERVDPPVSVSDALLSWASEAHWSMGGLSFKRLRLQGRIEGSISKLRGSTKTRGVPSVAAPLPTIRDSPPPAPMAVKRRRFLAMIEEEEEEEEEVEERRGRAQRRRLVKKLDDDFDRVASETAKDEDDDVSVAEVVNKVKSKGKRFDSTTPGAAIVNKGKSGGKKTKSGEESAATKPRTSPRFKST